MGDDVDDADDSDDCDDDGRDDDVDDADDEFDDDVVVDVVMMAFTHMATMTMITLTSCR